MKEYIKEQIKNAKLKMKPFPHLIVDNLIPQKEFNELKEEISKLTDFEQFTIHEGRFSITDDKWENSLNNLKKELYNDDIKNLLKEKFKEQLLKREEFNSESDWKLHLSVDKSYYEIPPHLDSPTKQLSVLFYLFGSKVGTSLYTNNHNGVEELDYKMAKKVDEVKFKENRLFVFCASIFDRTWHGVEKSKKEQKRFVIQGFLELRKKPKIKWDSWGKYSIRDSLAKRTDKY